MTEEMAADIIAEAVSHGVVREGALSAIPFDRGDRLFAVSGRRDDVVRAFGAWCGTEGLNYDMGKVADAALGVSVDLQASGGAFLY